MGKSVCLRASTSARFKNARTKTRGYGREGLQFRRDFCSFLTRLDCFLSFLGLTALLRSKGTTHQVPWAVCSHSIQESIEVVPVTCPSTLNSLKKLPALSCATEKDFGLPSMITSRM